MGNARFAAGASLAALGLMLAACGGGGVNSTPTPTPTGGGGGGGTPTPSTPTPPTQPNSTLPSLVPALAVVSSDQAAPMPGGVVIISTPAPTPTMPVNDDLLDPLASETFHASGVTGIVKVQKPSGAVENGSYGGGVTIAYDAAKQAYTLTSGQGTYSFSPLDIVASASDAHFTTFRKIAGNKGQSLVLTKPGTSGLYTYRYVGAGFLQQVTEYSDVLQGYLDVFIYGVRTPDGAVPKSGSASYKADMLAVIAENGALHDLYGEGTLGVNFTSGAVTTSGVAKQYAQAGTFERSRDWTGNAQLTAASGSFEGRLTVSGMTGAEWYGGFFGPNAQELGSVFQETNGGPTLVGTLIGRSAGQ